MDFINNCLNTVSILEAHIIFRAFRCKVCFKIKKRAFPSQEWGGSELSPYIIHNCLLQSSSQDYNLVYRISNVERNLQFTPKDRFLKKLLHGNCVFTQSFCQKSAESQSPKKYFFFRTWCLNPSLTSNKPTYYLLHYRYY